MGVLQVLILVDVEGPSVEAEIEPLLPDKRRDRIVLRLTEHDAPRIERRGPAAQPIDWIRLGGAVETVARKMKEAADAAPGDALHVYVGGKGPLPIFVHLGYAVSKFSGTQWVIGQQPGAAWELLPLASLDEPSNSLTAGVRPARSMPATGQLAVYADVATRPAPVDAITAAIELGGERVADVLELRPTDSIIVTPANAPGLASEVASRLAADPAYYPRRSSLALFVAGPTFFAFAVGRGVNPSIVGAARLFNYAGGAYELVYDLPFVDDTRPPVPTDEASIAAREQVRDVVLSAVEALKGEIAEDDLKELLPPDEWAVFMARLGGLSYVDTGSDEFALSIAGGTFSLGVGLLEALRNEEAGVQERFAKLLLLHELFHDHQNIRSTNYFEVGRAGVVLEAVDYAADVFALRALLRSVFRRAEPASIDDTRRITGEWFGAVVQGMQAFDRLDGNTIRRLADRRLRRYLTWNLQAVRAEFVDKPEHVEAILAKTVTAEVAPVTARVDRRFDREVLSATPATEFFAAIGGRLVRHGQRPGFDPGALVDAVRGFNMQEVRRAMRFIVEENRSTLVPWRR